MKKCTKSERTVHAKNKKRKYKTGRKIQKNLKLTKKFKLKQLNQNQKTKCVCTARHKIRAQEIQKNTSFDTSHTRHVTDSPKISISQMNDHKVHKTSHSQLET